MILSRRRGRIIAFQALYAFGCGSPAEDILKFDWVNDDISENIPDEALLFPRLLVIGTIENLSDIDNCIKRHLKNWEFSRLNYADKALLRLSTYSLLFQKDIPPPIIINEAINIANKFGTDDSYRFVNAVLDSIKNSE